MTAEKTEAIVIRQTDFSETSRVVSFFTREQGRISTIAKGGRRLKGPFESALDLLAHCRIVFLRKSSASLDILTEAQLISRFVPGNQSLKSLYGGYYIAELLTSLTEEYDPYPLLFDAAVATLRQLSQTDDPLSSILRFEIGLLRDLGHLPPFDECAACRRELTADAGPFTFWVSQGGLLCARCRKEEYSRHLIQPGTVAILNRIADPDDALSDRLSISAKQNAELRSIVTPLISHLMSRRPKMARYLQL